MGIFRHIENYEIVFFSFDLFFSQQGRQVDFDTTQMHN